MNRPLADRNASPSLDAAFGPGEEARREAAMADALKEVDRVLASTKYTAEDLGAGDAVRVRGGKTPSRSLDADRGYGGV